MKRRGLLIGALALVVPVAAVSATKAPILWADGVHDDTEAVEAFFRGERVYFAKGGILKGDLLSGQTFRISRQVRFSGAGPLKRIENCVFDYLP